MSTGVAVQNTKNRLVRFFPDPETSFPALVLLIFSTVYFYVTFAGKQNLIPKAFFIRFGLSILDETKFFVKCTLTRE